MSFVAWTAAVGVLLLSMAFASGWIRRLPLTDFVLYLAVGVAAGPWGLHLLDVDFVRDAAWLERLTEVALIISLFAGGLKLRVSWQAMSWKAGRRLAFPAMLLGIAGATLAVHGLLALDWAHALVLGAMLAPTDPVLASAISVDDASDRDGLRVALSAEAGLNDGAALPFLLLGLSLIGQPLSWGTVGQWALVHLLWGIAGALLVGFSLGWLAGKISMWLSLRSLDPQPGAVLTLGLIALTYAIAQMLGVLGFIAVFTAGVGMRTVEMSVVGYQASQGAREHGLQPAESLLGAATDGDDISRPTQAVGRLVASALTFGNVMEHLLAPLMVLLVGITLARHWSLDGLLVMLPLFFVIRPLAVWLGTLGLGLPWQRRLLLGWLGIRGIGALNYLAYAIMHGLAGAPAQTTAGVVVTVICASVVLHGLSARPLLGWRRRQLDRYGLSGR